MTEAALIQGIELYTRTLVPYKNEKSEENSFLVGTQSLRSENQIHKLTYNEDSCNALAKKSYVHKLGEIWHLNVNQKQPEIISSCFNTIEADSCSQGGAIFKIGDNLELIYLLDIPTEYGTEVRQLHFDPSGTQFASIVDSQALLWDLESRKILQSTQKYDAKGNKNPGKVFAARFNPPGDCFVMNLDAGLNAYDTRDLQKKCWTISNAHSMQIRSIDFNINRPNMLVTAGDDCAVRFWDVRKLDNSLLTMRNHSHWVWCVRFNPCYDQLLLTASSDSKVHLLRVASISDEETEEEDTVIECYEDHEDSIYATEWAPNDPWLFASISYDGRMVINRVPKEEKFRILC